MKSIPFGRTLYVIYASITAVGRLSHSFLEIRKSLRDWCAYKLSEGIFITDGPWAIQMYGMSILEEDKKRNSLKKVGENFYYRQKALFHLFFWRVLLSVTTSIDIFHIIIFCCNKTLIVEYREPLICNVKLKNILSVKLYEYTKQSNLLLFLRCVTIIK